MIKQELKLQRQLSKRRKQKDGSVKDYDRFVFTISPDVIQLMGWDDEKLKDVEFQAKAHPKTGKLVIEKKE